MPVLNENTSAFKSYAELLYKLFCSAYMVCVCVYFYHSYPNSGSTVQNSRGFISLFNTCTSTNTLSQLTAKLEIT